MAFQSVDKVLLALKRQPEWQEWQEFEKLSQSWTAVVGSVVSKHARPRSLRDGVLQVSTSTAVWAQELSFERTRILQKLNPKLTRPLKDIRFSWARWHSRPQPVSGLERSGTLASPRDEGSALGLENRSPSRLEPTPLPAKAQTPQEAFEGWAQKIQARSRGWSVCPQCNCPTPPAELQRWSICAPCVAQKS